MMENNFKDIPDLTQVRDKFTKSRYCSIDRKFFEANKTRYTVTELSLDRITNYDDYYEANKALLCLEEVDRMSKMIRVRFQYKFTIDPISRQISIGFENEIIAPFILDPSSLLGSQLVADVQPCKINTEGDTYLVFDVVGLSGAKDNLIKLSPALDYPESTIQKLSGIIIQRSYLIPPFEIFDRCNEAMRKIKDESHFLRRVLTAQLSGDSESILKDFASTRPLIDLESTDTPELSEKLSSLDDDQRKAVKDILSAKFRPFPYIIGGIPGSGKTRTLIAAIYQVFKRSAGSKKILVCASSKSYLAKLYEQVLSGPLSGSWIGEHNVDTSRFDDHRIKPGNCKGPKDCTIYFATTVKCALFDDAFFDYIFLDNASATHQPESLIAWSKLKADGCFVMSGDPNQEHTDMLGRATGDVVSMFELFAFSKVPEDFDRRYITYLIRSYRCDTRIINWTISELYGEQISVIDRTPTGYPLHSKPIQLVDVRAPHNLRLLVKQDNLVKICLKYLNNLHHEHGINFSDIGVIAMSQRVYLRDSLRESLREPNYQCKVDTVDNFDGLSKRAIVIVLDPFRKDEPTETNYIFGGKRRLTKAVSRAECLVIIIGDFRLLETVDIWKKLSASAQLITENIAFRAPIRLRCGKR